jgi:hypothetical protein
MQDYPVKLTIEYPARLSRGWVVLKLFFGWLYAGIPHGVCLWLYGIAVSIVSFVAFWVILITAKYPRGLFDFVTRYIRWYTRLTVYLSLMRDEYPPFNGNE